MKRRHIIRLPAELRIRVELFAGQHGLRFAPAVRLLLAGALNSAGADDGQRIAWSAAFAALIASEQTALMVASILPEGEQKWLAMAGRAAERADERLAALERAAQETYE